MTAIVAKQIVSITDKRNPTTLQTTEVCGDQWFKCSFPSHFWNGQTQTDSQTA